MSFWSSLGALAGQGGVSALNYNLNDKIRKKDLARSEYFERNALSWRVEDAAKWGIHPLAAIGASTQASPVYSSGNTGVDVRGLSDAIQNLFTRKTEAETDLLKAKAEALRQSETTGQKSTRLSDGDVEVVPAQVTSKSPNTGIESGVSAQMRYELKPNGYYEMVHVDTEGYSDEAPIDRRIQDMWDRGAWKANVLRLKNNWNNPDLQWFKKYMLASRPPEEPGTRNVMTNSGRWRQIKATADNKGLVFEDTRVIKPRNKKHVPYYKKPNKRLQNFGGAL